MKEDFLHYIWRYKKFNFPQLFTTNKESLSIIKTGDYLQLAGPDFFNAHIEIEDQKWAGNIEIHVKSSDWYLHHHERDDNYNSVILHVVWEHDAAVFRKDNSEIPVLELKNFVPIDLVSQYQKLKATKSWINCENDVSKMPQFIIQNWQERLFFERLERKSQPIESFLNETDNDWEATFFCFLAKNFGLNTNGNAFFKMAKSIPFAIFRKEAFDVENIEALFFGRTGLLNEDKEDNYYQDLRTRWNYLQYKYKLETIVVEEVQFFKHRPDNFPTIRLSQLANLYHTSHNLFSKVMEVKGIQEVYDLFAISVSKYWQTHYQFDKVSPKKTKSLSNAFIDLLIINTIVPFRFAFDKSRGKELSEENIELLENIAPENNAIINKFKTLSLSATNAFQTQSLLQLKNEYCNHGKCLQCAFGVELLKA
jgi:Protein of unknown function (DUF2851)